MSPDSPAANWTVAETMHHCPEVIPLFQKFGMACTGCSMAPFETLAEAAEAYALDVQMLLAAFRQVTGRREKGIRGSARGGPKSDERSH